MQFDIEIIIFLTLLFINLYFIINYHTYQLFILYYSHYLFIIYDKIIRLINI